MTRYRHRLTAIGALALLVPALALAQTPAPPGPAPAAAPETRAPEVAPPPAAPAAPAPEAKDEKDAAKEPAKEAPKEPAKAPAKDATPKFEPPQATGPLAPLAWLHGCWAGSVNERNFREYWLPLRGGLMVGAGHNVFRDRTVSYEYLRLESNADGVFYVAVPSGQKETPFKLTSTRKDGPDEIFTFSNAANPFPQFISYRRATGGWLYVEVFGKQAGKDQKVIYPFRRVDCESGEFIRK